MVSGMQITGNIALLYSPPHTSSNIRPYYFIQIVKWSDDEILARKIADNKEKTFRLNRNLEKYLHYPYRDRISHD